jgi:hypothetical protein
MALFYLGIPNGNVEGDLTVSWYGMAGDNEVVCISEDERVRYFSRAIDLKLFVTEDTVRKQVDAFVAEAMEKLGIADAPRA